MPVVSFPERIDSPQVIAPLDLADCPRCTLVQLRHTVFPDLMFRNYWYRSGVSATMRAALKDVVESVQRWTELLPGMRYATLAAMTGRCWNSTPTILRKSDSSPLMRENWRRKKASRVFRLLRPEELREGEFKAITACAMFYDLSDPDNSLRT